MYTLRARAARPLLTLIAFGLCSLGTSCKRAAERPPLPVRVVRVQVEPGDESVVLASPPLDTAALAEAASAGLMRAGVRVELVPQKPEPGDFTLQMELVLKRVTPKPGRGAPTGSGDVMRALTAGQLRARVSGDALTYDETVAARQAPELSKLQHIGLAERPAGADTSADAPLWGPLAKRAVSESAHTLGEQLQLLGSPSSQLMAMLSDGKVAADVRGVAAQLLALRKERAAVPMLIALLAEKDAPVELRDQTIGALVEIGDRRAVRPLLDSARFSDEVEMGKVVEAVASLGGEEARSYLRFVAQSHGVPRVREEAKTALSHLEQREQRHDAGSE